MTGVPIFRQEWKRRAAPATSEQLLGNQHVHDSMPHEEHTIMRFGQLNQFVPSGASSPARFANMLGMIGEPIEPGCAKCYPPDTRRH